MNHVDLDAVFRDLVDAPRWVAWREEGRKGKTHNGRLWREHPQLAGLVLPLTLSPPVKGLLVYLSLALPIQTERDRIWKLAKPNLIAAIERQPSSKQGNSVMSHYRFSTRFALRTLQRFIGVIALTLGIAGLGNAQVHIGTFRPERLDGPDPAQMEDAPDLGVRAVEHGLKIPDDLEMGAPSSVVWTAENRILVFNRGPDPLMEFEANGDFVRSWGQGDYLRPHGMRLDPEGNIWTTDVNGHTVRKMNLAGEVDWGMVATLLEDGYRSVAPRRAIAQLDSRD